MPFFGDRSSTPLNGYEIGDLFAMTEAAIKRQIVSE